MLISVGVTVFVLLLLLLLITDHTVQPYNQVFTVNFLFHFASLTFNFIFPLILQQLLPEIPQYPRLRSTEVLFLYIVL